MHPVPRRAPLGNQSHNPPVINAAEPIDVVCTVFRNAGDNGVRDDEHGHHRTAKPRTVAWWRLPDVLRPLLRKTVPLPEGAEVDAADAAKRGLPGVVFGLFGGYGRRCDANLDSLTALPLDLDRVHDVEALTARLRTLRCLTYHSPKSGLFGYGDRMRVIVALDRPIPPHGVEVARRALAEHLGVDYVSSGIAGADSASQLSFCGGFRGRPARELEVYDGEVWTPPDPGEAPPRSAIEPELGRREPTYDADRLPVIPEALITAIEPEVDGQRFGGYKLMRGVAGLLARKGFHPEAIAVAVRDGVPSAKPEQRAREAREAAEQWYAGGRDGKKTAGPGAIVEHFDGLGVDGAKIVKTIDEANTDKWLVAWLSGCPLSWARAWCEYYDVPWKPRGKIGAANDVIECTTLDWAWEPWDQIMRPLPPVDWLCGPLGIAAGGGRPNLFVGRAGSGKTYTAQAFALAVATGGKMFGEWPCKQGVVRHIDLDQGRRPTALRYQQLAAGLGVAGRDVPLATKHFGLRLVVNERVDREAVDELERAVDGAALVLIDSLRGLAPGCDENSAGYADVLGELAAVSDRTGVTWLVLHHSGKSENGRIRGTTAIEDRAGAVWVGAKTDGAVLWTQDKCSELGTEPHAPFTTTFEKRLGGAGPEGTRVRLSLLADAAKPSHETGSVKPHERQAVAAILAKHAHGSSSNQVELTLKDSIGRNRARETIKVMVQEDLIQREGAKGGMLYLTDRGKPLVR